MAHLLIIELPGGSDSDILQAACTGGHSFSFASADMRHYRDQPALWQWLQRAHTLIDLPGLEAQALMAEVALLHAQHPVQGLLCLVDIRIQDAAGIAQMLGLPFLNPASAALLRDKFLVRSHLQAKGLAQPPFALACSTAELQAAVQALGLPVLIKPVDGFGSQNIVLLREPEDLDPWLSPLENMLPSGVNYGLGVAANDRLLVERWMPGIVVGCDTMSHAGVHTLLGTNTKVYYEPPSFAIRGGCFTPWAGQDPALQAYVFSLLDAVGFDWGAAHVEIMLTAQGPALIEINPRLVGAKIGRLISLAWGASVHQWLIDLHLGHALQLPQSVPRHVAATRWVTAMRSGRLAALELPAAPAPEVRVVEVLKQAGDAIALPMDNADRIAYVMTCAPTAQAAQDSAEAYVSACTLHYLDELPAP